MFDDSRTKQLETSCTEHDNVGAHVLLAGWWWYGGRSSQA